MKEKIKNIFKKGKWLSNLALTILLMAIVVAVTVGINVFVSSRNLSEIDLTKEKLYSLSQESKDKIKNIQQDRNNLHVLPKRWGIRQEWLSLSF